LLALNGLGTVLLKNGILCGRTIFFMRIVKVLYFRLTLLFGCAVLGIERKLTEGIRKAAYYAI